MTFSCIEIHGYQIEPLLQTVKNTAPGCDNMPSLLFQKCSVKLADVVAKLLNISFASGRVYANWKMALVTPVSKVSNLASLGDFRPISVTPILSSIAEKIVVKRWLYPAIPFCTIKDQFAFHPTGSTTCALINLLHHISRMLVVIVDFIKAFDIVNHNILLPKISALDLPDNIHYWISPF